MFCRIWLLVLAVGVCAPSFAQVNAGQLLEQAQQTQRPKTAPLPPEAPDKPADPKIPAIADGEVGVRIRSLILIGDPVHLSDTQWKTLNGLVKGKELSFIGLQGLADRVASMLRSDGFPLAQAFLPEQDVSQGVLRIAVQLGRFDNPAFEVIDKAARLRPGLVSQWLAIRLQPGEVVRGTQLNEALILVNELSGVSAQGEFIAGDQPGTARLRVTVQEESPLQIRTGLANTGNKTTGIEMLSTSVQRSNALGFGERFGLSLNRSRGMSLWTGDLAWPANANGGWLEMSLSQLHYESISQDPGMQGLNGDSVVGSFTWRQALWRDLRRSASWQANFEYKKMVDDNLVGADVFHMSDKLIQAMNLRLDGQQQFNVGAGLSFSGRVGLRVGRLSLPDRDNVTSNLASDQNPGSGLFTQGDYRKFTWQLQGQQFLGAGWYVGASGTGQRALGHKNLDGSEKMSLGGPNGVRAYPSGEASGDHAHILSAELGYSFLLPNGESVGVSAFYDKGWIWMYANPTIAGRSDIASNDQQLSHYALGGYGMNFVLSRSGRFSLSITWARKDGPNPGSVQQGKDSDGRSDRERWWLSYQLQF